MSDVVLALTSPHMTGSVVEQFQRDMNTRLDAWDVPHQVDVDGDYGQDSRDTAASILYGLGVDSGGDFDGVSSTDRLKVRYGYDRLTNAEKAVHDSDQRVRWRKKYADRYGGGAVKVALNFAAAQIGVTEHPAGSNRGPQVDVWERACNVLGAPWCGCFANAVLVAGGLASDFRLRYCPAIEAIAKNGESGWLWTHDPQPGDLVLYGSSIASHVGIVETIFNGRDQATIEGNTSNGPGGSQSNGGIVARRHRHEDGSLNGFPIRGYARPPLT